MSRFNCLDYGINFLVISLIYLLPIQGAHHVLTLFYHFHGHMTTSADFPGHTICGYGLILL